MKVILITLFAILVLINFGECAVFFNKFTGDKDHPGKCVIKQDGAESLILNPGESKKIPTKCVKVQCGEKLDADFMSCGVIGGIPSECTLSPVDVTKDYPDCCPHMVC